MEDNLIDHLEVGVEEPRRNRPARPTYLFSPSDVHGGNRNSVKTASKPAKVATSKKEERVLSGAAAADNGIHLVVERPDALPETVVAVFPPSDLYTSENRQADESRFYQTSDSTISSIKCVMSTILFLAVVAIIIVVAFVKNPGM